MAGIYFSRREIECGCGCGEAYVDPTFLDIMNDIRDKYGSPIIVNSWYRCEAHDKSIGGKGNHTTGMAVDIKVGSSKERKRLILVADRTGITRIGIGSNFLHLDIMDRTGARVPNVWWHYRR